MKKVLIILSILSLFTLFIIACGGPSKMGGKLLWDETIDNNSKTDLLYDMEIDNGFLYSAGITESEDNSNAELMITKFEIETKTTTWVKIHDVSGSSLGDRVRTMTIYNDAVYVAGFQGDGTSNNWMITKFNTSDGEVYDTNWENGIIFDSTYGNDELYAIEADDTGLYVAGIYRDDAGSGVMGIAKLSHTDGSIDSSWGSVKTFLKTGYDRAECKSIAIVGDEIYMAGILESSTVQTWMLSVNKSDGTEGSFNVIDTELFGPTSIVEDSGFIYVASSVSGYWVVKKFDITEGSEDPNWTTFSVEPDEETLNQPRDMLIDGDFLYVVGNINKGLASDPIKFPDIGLAKLNKADGSFAEGWNKVMEYDPSDGSEDDAYAIAVDAENLYIGGYIGVGEGSLPEYPTTDWWFGAVKKEVTEE